ncbi:MAG: helix-turn-helix transcriptional regulator [Formivibrio sp.]|nr:helix-turn-helix transcriptional regulator [Formivibrio sp.]
MDLTQHSHIASLIEPLRRQRCRPPPELATYIDNYLLLDINALGADLPRLLPSAGAICFFFYGTSLTVRNLHTGTQETSTDSFLICNRHHVLDLSANGATGLMVINFRPGRLRYFTDASFSELQDHLTSTTDLWGARASEVPDKLAEAHTFAECASILSEFFLKVLKERQATRLDLMLDLLYLSPATRIAELAEQGGWSLRHFERQFASTYGVTPKYFARVARMQQVARRLALEPGAGTLESALDAGFFDQSHFIHELTKLAGLSASELARGVRERPHFYNPKALQWYLCHMNNMVSTLGAVNISLNSPRR